MALIAFLMQKEMEDKDESQAREFKNLIFAHDVVPRNPGLFYRLYQDFESMTEEEEEGLDWVAPETEADVQALMSELRATGWRG